jgi:hypothetical protein
VAGLLALALTACATMKDQFLREVASAGLTSETPPGPLVTEQDLAPLPSSVQRYMRFMGVVGRPRDWSFRLSATGRFRLKNEEKAWFDIEMWQYNNRMDLSRIFHMRGRMSGFLPVVARDTYVRGKGHMLGKLFDLIPVADGQGPEYDLGELATYLDDAIVFAPSFLLGPETRWQAVDAHAFDVSLTDHGITATARVLLDERGAPRDVVTTDRFLEDPDDPKHPLIRGEWHTPIDGWQRVDGRAIPTGGKGVWQLKEGPYTYAEFRFDPETLAFNTPPGH